MTGNYIATKGWFPCEEYWECGDGCCSGWETTGFGYDPAEGEVFYFEEVYNGMFEDYDKKIRIYKETLENCFMEKTDE